MDPPAHSAGRVRGQADEVREQRNYRDHDGSEDDHQRHRRDGFVVGIALGMGHARHTGHRGRPTDGEAASDEQREARRDVEHTPHRHRDQETGSHHAHHHRKHRHAEMGDVGDDHLESEEHDPRTQQPLRGEGDPGVQSPRHGTHIGDHNAEDDCDDQRADVRKHPPNRRRDGRRCQADTHTGEIRPQRRPQTGHASGGQRRGS